MSELALPKIDNSILNRKSEIVKTLSKWTDKEHVLSEADELRPYETDALSVYTQTPLAVVLPENTDEVSEILKYCYKENILISHLPHQYFLEVLLLKVFVCKLTEHQFHRVSIRQLHLEHVLYLFILKEFLLSHFFYLK
jgi:hypothetical protein